MSKEAADDNLTTVCRVTLDLLKPEADESFFYLQLPIFLMFDSVLAPSIVCQLTFRYCAHSETALLTRFSFEDKKASHTCHQAYFERKHSLPPPAIRLSG